MTVRLNTIERVKRFVELVARVDATLKLQEGKQAVDAKSILGIFSLNLQKPMTLVVEDGDVERVYQLVKEFVIA